MKNIGLYLLSICVGIAIYAGLFVFVLHQPLTTDTIGSYVSRKAALLQRNHQKKIIILAGSNGRFSHSCAEIFRQTNISCVNLSISADIGLKYQINHYIDYFAPGDLIYLPLEYRNSKTFNATFVGGEAPYLVYNSPLEVFSLYSSEGQLKTFFGFDFPYLLSSVGEMILNKIGVKRRFSLGTMNEYGDETTHDEKKAAAYGTAITAWPRTRIDPVTYSDEKYWSDLSSIISRLRKKKLIVVGGLPTTFDDTVVASSVVSFLSSFYENQGACFLKLPNSSLYPRSYFYDTNYHLTEKFQHLHSGLLASKLAQIFRKGDCVETFASKTVAAHF